MDQEEDQLHLDLWLMPWSFYIILNAIREKIDVVINSSAIAFHTWTEFSKSGSCKVLTTKIYIHLKCHDREHWSGYYSSAIAYYTCTEFSKKWWSEGPDYKNLAEDRHNIGIFAIEIIVRASRFSSRTSMKEDCVNFTCTWCIWKTICGVIPKFSVKYISKSQLQNEILRFRKVLFQCMLCAVQSYKSFNMCKCIFLQFNHISAFYARKV